MSTKHHIDALVDQAVSAMAQLASVMSDPSSLDFEAVREGMVKLESITGAKSTADAAFAWIAERSNAGRLVGSTRSVEYLTKTLGISYREAVDRLARGENLFTTPVAEPVPAAPMPSAAPSSPEDGAEADSAEERRRREEAARKEAEARHRRDREAQERARKKAQEVAAEKQRIISQELRNLGERSRPSKSVLHEQSLEQAEKRTPEDLRIWLRRQVKNANAAARRTDGTKDPFAGYKRRFLSIGEPEEDGNVRVVASLPASLAAMLKAALAPGLRPGANTTVPEGEDKRRRSVRAVDQLEAILKTHLADESKINRQGVGSVVVSMTTDDVKNMSSNSVFLSNTGDLLTPFDILKLGAAAFDLGMLHDTKGKPLAVGRTARTATLYQRLALFALEGLCACGSCSGAAIYSHVHHIQAWIHGGMTDLENLTLACPSHHADNNDNRDGARGMGHMTRDKATGRAAWKPAGSEELQFNETELQEHSAGARIRARNRAHETGLNPHKFQEKDPSEGDVGPPMSPGAADSWKNPPDNSGGLTEDDIWDELLYPDEPKSA
ncbi:HNH endonuclease [Corynebacterium atrinae]|uniref:HNH endonuclease signature motif containing protein n=1 Tax=Corynebacterium atrinae TaxID=1336740 RepID=UPI0025B55854|nr:HNH endonuclease signature motif containing protein [Corynebacterium atrinae]WJY63043.1 HNH endonuclease [Corynebacterium atrinae]